MKTRGIITQYNSREGFGVIITSKNEIVNFERFECNYDFIRVGDEVFFDLVKISNGKLDSLNVEFCRNSILSELNSCYQSQTKIKCKIIKKTKLGYIVDYKGINILLNDKDVIEESIAIGDYLNLFIKFFSQGSHIIASTQSRISRKAISKYQKFIGKNNFFEFEVVDYNDFGLIVFDKELYGFIPVSHILPLKGEEINIGSSINASVIQCTINKGLILSIRNLLLYKILEELNLAYLEQIKLQGSVKSISSKIYLIDYKGINLLMNHDYLLNEVTIGSTIEFKIIDFSWTAAISISTIEVTDSGLLKKLRTDNLFQGTISKVFKNGLLIKINEYYTGYMSNTEISDNWLLDSEPLKEGSKINLSIMKFDYKGLALSRINFKKNKKKSNASSFYKVGDIIEMKIYDKMIFSGLLVKDGTVKGLIPIDKIIPEEVIKEINLLYFIKFCQNLFKKHSFIKCVVCNVEGENNKLLFDIDYEDDRNKSNIIKIIDYFSNDRNLKKIVVDYLNSRLK